jgi:hypothetical protein
MYCDVYVALLLLNVALLLLNVALLLLNVALLLLNVLLLLQNQKGDVKQVRFKKQEIRMRIYAE